MNDSTANRVVEGATVGGKYQRDLRARRNRMRPLYIQRRFHVPGSRRTMWVVGHALRLQNRQIHWWQIVDLRKQRSILGDGGRAEGIGDHDRFPSSIKACLVERIQTISGPHFAR